MRQYRLCGAMVLIAVVAISLALGGYLEGVRREAASKLGRGKGAANVAPPVPASASPQQKYSTYHIGAFY